MLTSDRVLALLSLVKNMVDPPLSTKAAYSEYVLKIHYVSELLNNIQRGDEQTLVETLVALQSLPAESIKVKKFSNHKF